MPGKAIADWPTVTALPGRNKAGFTTTQDRADARPRTTAMKKVIKRWMVLNGADYDTATERAEACADQLDHPEWLDDETHFVWEAAADFDNRIDPLIPDYPHVAAPRRKTA